MTSIALFILTMATMVTASNDLRPFQESKADLEKLPKQRADYAKYRLPGPTIPSYYTIILRIDPNDPNKAFTGEVAIDMTTNTPVNKIVLHSNVTVINSITVMAKESNVNLYDRHISATDDTYFLTIHLTQNLSVNQVYVININYVGMYRNDLYGVYLSSYTDANNTKRRLATTQFEPIYARSGFPCYDEPGFRALFDLQVCRRRALGLNGLKAVFQTNVYTPPGYYTISNTDQINTKTLAPMQGGFSLFAFEPTVRMSSYLNAFIISDFIYKSNLDRPSQVFPKKFRIFSKPNTEPYIDFALDFGEKSISCMEKYTNITYALKKLDNIAIPDFAAGAMENWGLITYREQRLLDIPGVTSTSDKQFIATIMSHEISHMWFGNEVSPSWWDYLWLSEGFATYFANYITQEVAPEWRTMDQYVEVLRKAMKEDSEKSSNPMTSSVASPQEIIKNPNTIAYGKSGSVIRMMEHILGTAIFRQGLQNYLKSIPLGLAEPQKLFDGLQAATDGKHILPDDLTVTDIFGIWSTQPGYPLVTATGGDNGSINLKQTRFYQTNMTSSEKWWIPITWVTSKGGDFQNTLVQRWFSPNDSVLNIPLELDEDSWFILNKQKTGYYRVMYDEKNWKLLTEALKAILSSIHLLNRAQLIDDSLELARTLRLNYTTVYDLLFHLKEETDYIPWLTVLPGINQLSLMMPAATNFNKYREFLLQITDKVYQSIGFEPKPNDDYITRMKRNVILNIACNGGNNDCRKNSNKKLELLTQNYNTKIDPDVKDSVYCSGLRDATKDLWEFFWNKYINATSNFEKITILRYLACSEDVAILQDYLMLTVTNNSGLFYNYHRYIVVKSVINAGHVGVDQAVKFITTNFTAIKSMGDATIDLMQDMTFERTQKNGVLLICDGFCYTRHRSGIDTETEYWVCENRKICNGRAITKSNRREFRQTKEHSHLPDRLRREIRQIQGFMQQAASNAIGASTTTSIVQRSLMAATDVAKARLPSINHLKRNVQRQRNKAQVPLPLPITRSDIDVPTEYQITGSTTTPEQFLFWDSGSGSEERILMFTTRKNLEFLKSCQSILMDGTFKTAPPLFTQLYSIHGTRLEGTDQKPGKAVPLIFCLLPDKSGTTYNRLFSQLKMYIQDWEPNRVMMDFERAAINAVQNQWPNAQVTGCFFHLSQSIYRKIQELGLTEFYDNQENAIKFKMVLALAFVPPENVVESWEELLQILNPWLLEQEREIQQKVDDFLIYFEVNYIGKIIANVRREPRVASIDIWNVRDRIIHNYGKTDNEVEGFHMKVGYTIGAQFPNLWKFLKALQGLQAETEKLVEELNSGVMGRQQRPKYVQLAERIKNVTANWANRQSAYTGYFSRSSQVKGEQVRTMMIPLFESRSLLILQLMVMPEYTVTIINYIKNRVVTKENVDQFNEFAKTGDFTKNEKESVDAAQSKIATNKERLDIILPDIDSWLLENDFMPASE
ncbi:aminopeptidase N-like [Arctopsyche grandis]|uniref:aminopeptidase N-like n=1 Tax=Arctopsyche grandis TaxID=121162 RepID=UPI00406D8EC8